MADPPSPESPQEQERHSVLGDLPRTRPQRPSARRERARSQAAKSTAATEAAAKAPKAKRASKGQAAADAKPATKPARADTEPASADTKPPRQAKPRPASSPRPRRSSKRAASVAPSAPRQGYECDNDLTGSPVAPPSGTEVVGALAELAGELAQTGISAGGRLIKSALSRLSSS